MPTKRISLGILLTSAEVSFSAKFRLKLKKVGKNTIPFRYDLNQIPMIIQWKQQIDSRDEI